MLYLLYLFTCSLYVRERCKDGQTSQYHHLDIELDDNLRSNDSVWVALCILHTEDSALLRKKNVLLLKTIPHSPGIGIGI